MKARIGRTTTGDAHPGPGRPAKAVPAGRSCDAMSTSPERYPVGTIQPAACGSQRGVHESVRASSPRLGRSCAPAPPAPVAGVRCRARVAISPAQQKGMQEMKFGIGQPMRRFEDLRLLRGQGRYTDDITLPNLAHAVVLRSPVAHARITRLDTAAARGMAGVLLVLTGADVTADGIGDVPCTAPLTSRDGKPRHDTPRPVLAIGKVRHVGQPVALVVAETVAAARDAAEAIEVDYDALPAVTESDAAIAPGA